MRLVPPPLLVLLLLAATPAGGEEGYVQAHPDQAAPNEAQFDYRLGGPIGPEHWGEQAEEWRLCGSGRSQSPINIDSRTIVGAASLSTRVWVCFGA